VEIATPNERFVGNPYFYGNQGVDAQVPGVRGQSMLDYPLRDGPSLNTQFVPQVYVHPDDYYIYAPYAGPKGTGSQFPWVMDDPTERTANIYPAYVQEPRSWGPYPSLSFGMLPGVDTRGLHYDQPYYRRQVIPPTYTQEMDYQIPLQRSYERNLGRARRLRQMA
jgi:hypothetical protein